MYERVVVATDLSDLSMRVLKQALDLVGNDPSRLILAHVVDPIPTIWGLRSTVINPLELQEKFVAAAKKMLAHQAASIGVSEANQHVLVGTPQDEIRELQQAQQAKAIVIGSHGHSGWKRILGSTAIKLLHGATCDVITVFVGDEQA